MSANLSSDQFGQYTQSVTKMGAMPRNKKFDDPQPAKMISIEDQFAPNKSQPLAKPGFF
jgi:hypothetical protein